MGRAYTAVADDVNAVFSNPAGLGLQKNWGLTSMTTKLLDRVDYRMLGAVYPTQFGTVGVGYLSATTPAGYLTTDQASLATAPAINYSSSLLVLSYGANLGEAIQNTDSLGALSVGANLKLISDGFDGVDNSANGTTMDLGVLYRANANVSGGLSFQNVGGSVNWKDGTKENLPTTGKIGIALNYDKVSAASDIEMGGGSSLVHGGVEFRPFDMLALRAGVDQARVSSTDTALNLTYGVGIKADGFSFDYAYRQDTTLNQNSASYFSISFQPVFKKPAQTAQKIDSQIDTSVSAVNPGIDGIYSIFKKKTANNSDASSTVNNQRDILRYYE
jgi:hypothetical protein